jgi:hypothetical protein
MPRRLRLHQAAGGGNLVHRFALVPTGGTPFAGAVMTRN